MSEHHKILSPSSFPMLQRCPCYASGEPGEAALSGTRQHRYLAARLTSAEIPEDAFGCDATERSQVEWAEDYVRRFIGESRCVEERLTLLGDDFEEITFGTLDVVGLADRAQGERLVVMDYKSGEDHGYVPQMAVYARMAMIRYAKTTCEVHEVYGRYGRASKYDLTLSDTDFILDIIDSVNNPDKQPRLNEFCKWCVKQGECHETTDAIVRVATEYEPDGAVARLPLDDVATWHASQITDPRQMSIVLEVATCLGDWAKSVKEHAKRAAMDGMEIPGYTLKDGKNTRAFASVVDAYHASGLGPDEFLACCSASVPDVEKAMAAKSGHKSEKVKAAKEDFEQTMGGVLVRKQNAPSLVKG